MWNELQNNQMDADGGGVHRHLQEIFQEVRTTILIDANYAFNSAANLHLYDGLAGIAFFLGAYHFATGDPEARRLALQSILPLRSVRPLDRDDPPHIGGMTGSGSLVYSLVQLSNWLQEPELLSLAEITASAITREQIAADKELNIISGCAGTLLALLSFINEASRAGIDSQPALDLAQFCGEHLLDSRVTVRRSLRAWKTVEPVPIPGFGYGVSGISYALAMLFQHTGLGEFREAAIEGFAYEHSLYVAEKQAWVDPRSTSLADRLSWCSGASGIALARTASSSAIGFSVLRHGLEEALNLCRTLADEDTDQLCCGNYGRIDALHTAGQMLERLHLEEYASHLSSQILSARGVSGLNLRACRKGTGEIQAPLMKVSLLSGYSGIGYVLLRLACPSMFPSLLLLKS